MRLYNRGLLLIPALVTAFALGACDGEPVNEDVGVFGEAEGSAVEDQGAVEQEAVGPGAEWGGGEDEEVEVP